MVVHNLVGNIYFSIIVIYAIHGSISIWLSHLLESLFSLTYPLCSLSYSSNKKSYKNILFLVVTHLLGSSSCNPFSSIQSLRKSIFPSKYFLHKKSPENFIEFYIQGISLDFSIEASLRPMLIQHNIIYGYRGIPQGSHVIQWPFHDFPNLTFIICPSRIYIYHLTSITCIQ